MVNLFVILFTVTGFLGSIRRYEIGGGDLAYLYENVTYNKNIPGMILMQDKPGRRCYTNLHWHSEIEIVYMVKGKMSIKINGLEHTISDGEFYLCNSNDVHITSVENREENYKYLVLLLSYSHLKVFCPELDQYEFSIKRNSEANERLKEQLVQMLTTIHSTDPYISMIQNAQIFNISHILLSQCLVKRKQGTTVLSAGNQIARQVISYINENYKEAVTLEAVSKQLGFSPQYLSKQFKKLTQYSFLQYLQKVRLDHALRCIVNAGYSVNDAAFYNGFPNVKSFIEACKKEYGETPGSFKRKQKESLMSKKA